METKTEWTEEQYDDARDVLHHWQEIALVEAGKSENDFEDEEELNDFFVEKRNDFWLWLLRTHRAMLRSHGEIFVEWLGEPCTRASEKDIEEYLSYTGDHTKVFLLSQHQDEVGDLPTVEWIMVPLRRCVGAPSLYSRYIATFDGYAYLAFCDGNRTTEEGNWLSFLEVKVALMELEQFVLLNILGHWSLLCVKLRRIPFRLIFSIRVPEPFWKTLPS